MSQAKVNRAKWTGLDCVSATMDVSFLQDTSVPAIDLDGRICSRITAAYFHKFQGSAVAETPFESSSAFVTDRKTTRLASGVNGDASAVVLAVPVWHS